MADTRLMWIESETGTPKLVERPQESRESEMPSVDDVIQRNDKQAAQQLQQGYKQAQGLIDRQITQGRQAILNQYQIRRNDMKRRYDAETDPKRKQSILDQTMSAKSQALAKIQALVDKHAPEKQDLDAQMQAEVQKMQQFVQQRNARIQYTRQLVQGGFMDPIQAKKAEYKSIGINWTPPKQQQTSEQKKAQLIRDIRTIDARLKKFTPAQAGAFRNIIPGGKPFRSTKAVYTDPFTGEERKLDPKNPKDAQTIEEMHELNRVRKDMLGELQGIYISENPALGKNIEDTQRFQDAIKIANNGGHQNIETSIRKKIGEQNKGKRVRVKAPDGQTGTVSQKELATFLAQGYKRVQ